MAKNTSDDEKLDHRWNLDLGLVVFWVACNMINKGALLKSRGLKIINHIEIEDNVLIVLKSCQKVCW